MKSEFALKVAIVTFEFEGITKNGGIGTAFRRLAESLKKQGHAVTTFLYPFPNVQDELLKVVQKNKSIGFQFEYVTDKEEFRRANPGHLTRSMTLYESLKNLDFDVIHFADNSGMAYHSVMAKKMGLAFAHTQLVIGTHGPCYWVREASQEFPNDPSQIAMTYMEKKAIEFADHVVSPSQYMVDFLKGSGWVFPKSTHVIPNINFLGRKVLFKNRVSQNKESGVIFFGRLEVRKGILLFVKALQELLTENSEWGSKQKLPIVFLGRDCPIGKKGMASQWVVSELRAFRSRIDLEFRGNLSSFESQQYIERHPGFLVCMPSLVDNSPYVVVEAIEKGFNFLSSGSGGQAELVHPSDRQNFLVFPSVEALKVKLIKRLLMPTLRCRPSLNAIGANSSWDGFHKKINTQSKRTPAKRSLPLVSICILDRNSQFHSEGIESARRQDYPRHEILQIENARDIRRAKGSYILLLEASKLISEDSVSKAMKAIQRVDADVAGMPLLQNGDEPSIFIPIIEDTLSSLFWPGSGHRAVFFERKTLLKALSQTEAHPGKGVDILKLLSVCQQMKKRMITIPESMVEGRILWVDYEASLRRSLDSLGTYFKNISDEAKELPLLLVGCLEIAWNLSRRELEKQKKREKRAFSTRSRILGDQRETLK